MSEVIDTTKWWAKALFIGAIVGIVALPIGALGSKFGIWPFTLGFMLLAVGVVLATIAFFVGIVAAFYSNSKKLHEERKKCLMAVAISVVVLGLMGNQFLSASAVPSIHNISTDTENPPQFETLIA
ncbi:MAG: formate hydrogenlyase subunit 3/multisubunit Na+/H+ antiporter MnhD subunit, partial [Candidatus Azotimanducaceae bacterium]